MNKRRIVFRFCLAALFITRPISGAMGQGSSGERTPSTSSRVPAMLALQDTTATEPGFRIIRNAGEKPLDVILLTGAADERTLSKAVRGLLVLRSALGDTATSTGEVRLGRGASARFPVHPYPWAERVMRDLRLASPQEVSGIGIVRAVEIWLPRQHRRSPPGT